MEGLRQRLMNELYDPTLMGQDTRFGHVSDNPVGKIFDTRRALCNARVHTATLAGISGSKNDGAFSIVVSGGYEDDKDDGETLEYTGTGGQGSATSSRDDGKTRKSSSSSWGGGPQIEDQSWDHSDNAALRRSYETQRPVRVIRGFKSDPRFAPSKGYRYDGLYKVTECRNDIGKSGFMICRVVLKREPNQPPLPENWQ